jgi:hypothetical protein
MTRRIGSVVDGPTRDPSLAGCPRSHAGGSETPPPSTSENDGPVHSVGPPTLRRGQGVRDFDIITFVSAYPSFTYSCRAP